MNLSIQINTNLHQFIFNDFPTARLTYQDTPPESPSDFIHFKTTNSEKVFSAFFKSSDLEIVGISTAVFKEVLGDREELKKFLIRTSAIQYHLEKIIPSIENHLSSKYLTFFQNTAYANTIISSCIHRKERHSSKIEGVPGIYIHYDTLSKVAHVFINLKKTRPLGRGSFGKVRKVAWLNAAENRAKIVAKKVHVYQSKEDLIQFQKEISALNLFSNKTGIISFICGGMYKDKLAIFLPFYEGTLFEYSYNILFSLPLHEKLSVALQLIEGLSTISEYGIHGDIKSRNILIKRGLNGLEAVISDFGCYRSYNDLEFGLTTEGFAPPDYHKEKKITLKHDTWGMGLCLYEFFSNNILPFTNNYSKKDTLTSISNLEPNWILKYPIRSDTPPFVLILFNEMLDPIAETRPNPKETFKQFLSQYDAFINRKKEKSD